MKYLEIKLLEGEYWWGGLAHDGALMPYGLSPFERDLSKEQLSNQSAPLLLSSKGRYVWSEKPFHFSFNQETIVLKSDLGEIELSDGHESLKGAFTHVSRKHFPASGKHPNPFLFTSPQYNTWIEMIYEPTQEKVISYAEAILKNGMPKGVIMIDDNWQEDYGVWNFNVERFPNPEEMVKKLHEMGFKVMLWVCNFISADSLTFRTLRDSGYMVKEESGKPAIAEWWNGYSGMLDVTNPEAVLWFKNRLSRLSEEYGIDGFKFDAGDLNHFKETFVCSTQSNANDYCEAWARVGIDYEFNEYRACWKLGGQALAQRLCDKDHAWSLDNGLGSLISNGLAQGLLGYAYTCPDMIGGGEHINFLENSTKLDEELIVRNAQCAALFPMMQFSVAPWRVLSKKNLEYCVEAAKLHEKMGSKILELAINSSKTGEPIIKHMEYVFPGKGYEKINDQFMLGDDILVAPVLEKGAVSRKIIFPEGRWIGDDGGVVQGPCTQEIPAPLSKLPWFRRQ